MKKITLSLFVLASIAGSAQNVAINATGVAPVASAMLDISSTTSGLLIPRMTSVQRTAIVAPAQGLKVYDTTTNSFWYFNGIIWVQILNSNTGWALAGNTLAGTEILGSVNAQPVRFFSSNVERMRLLANGQFGINTAAPVAGDLVSAYSNAANPWVINAYNTLNNGSGIYVSNTGATNALSAIEANQSSGSGAAVFGISHGPSGANPAGIIGQYSSGTTGSTAGVRIGVRGYSNRGSGNQQIGVYGNYNTAAWGIGVIGLSFGGAVPAGNLDIGVVGWRANNANYSGYFNGNHVIANGTKSGSVPTSKGNQLLYVTETPEVWFEDIGSGKLENGSVEIKLDPLFLETVVIDDAHPMHVFIQMEDECNDVYVKKGTTSFTVKEKNQGTSNASFSYRIMAKRINFQDHRFGNDPLWGPGDTRKYSKYAFPPPVDYQENIKFQEELKRNATPDLLPEGFVLPAGAPVSKETAGNK